MPRTKSQALTTAWVKQSTEPGAYSDGYGLTLRIDGKGSKRWIQRLTIEGRQRNAGLGSWPGVSLDEAREKALVNWRVAREGRDPIAERRMAKANARMPRMPTFEEVARRVIALRRPTWSSEKHAGQWESTLATYVFPAIGRQLVNAVTTADVIAILEPIWTTKAETATRVRQRMEVVFDYAIASGWRVDNPAIAVTKALPRRRGKKEHHPAMTYGRMPAFIQTLRASTADSSTKLGLEFLILTAARTGEVRFMEWREVDTGAATWTVPASRMKARREHRVPLSRPALAVLEEVRNVGTGRGLVFPSRKGKVLSNMAFNMLLRRLDIGDAVPHGFRSTFKDWTLEETSLPWAVVEAALAHTLGSATEAAYVRSDLSDKRRELMEAWARHCEREESQAKAAELPEDSCVVCHNPIPEERRGRDTCSPGCAAIMVQARRLASTREWRRRQRTGPETDATEEEQPRQEPVAEEASFGQETGGRRLSRAEAFEQAGRRHSLQCQEQGASPNVMGFLPGAYYRCKGCDCWCHLQKGDVAEEQPRQEPVAEETGLGQEAEAAKRPREEAFEQTGRRHSLQCQEHGASPNIMGYLPRAYYLCPGCDCWCHMGA